MTNYPLSAVNVRIQILLTDLHTFSLKKNIVEGIVKRTESNVALVNISLQSNLFNTDTKDTETSVHFTELSILQR